MRDRSHRFLFPYLALASAVAAQSHREPPTVETPSSFAIVVDEATWKAIPGPIRRYRDAVQADGLATWIVAGDWQTPEAVRDTLCELHRGKSALEGAILVGRIPVAMFRGAQHLTTAFKMDEVRYPKERSSVPSDRFYEDFDLVLERLDGDADQPLLHYYRLAPESAQRIEKEIYSARLSPAGDDTAANHAAIAVCLERFADCRQAAPTLDRVLTLMGHGYVSESLDAWAADRSALGELAPSLQRPGGALVALHHERDVGLEPALLRELADPALDLAILHSHGDDDRQFLIGAPPLPSAVTQVAALRKYLRDRLRRARARGESEAETQRELTERFQLSPEWFAGAFDEAVTAADAAGEASKELVTQEIAAVACGAEVVDLDSCFNGAFTAPLYQAGAYLFGAGTTRAVVANSVNVAQDVWCNQNLGILSGGGRIGAWHRARPHLESHLFGDPTFRFAPVAGNEVAARQLALRSLPASPAADEVLLDTLQTDVAAIVRLEALAGLARHRGPALTAALPVAARDPSALVRRAAVTLMGDVDDPSFLQPLLGAALRDPCERVAYKARDALAKYDASAVAQAFEMALAALPLAPGGDREVMLRQLQTPGFIADYRTEAADRSLESSKRISALRTFRLYRVHAVIPELLALANAADEDPAVRTAALEALGWFVYSTRREVIAAAASALTADGNAPAALRAEGRKTIQRLAAGANDPLLP